MQYISDTNTVTATDTYLAYSVDREAESTFRYYKTINVASHSSQLSCSPLSKEPNVFNHRQPTER